MFGMGTGVSSSLEPPEKLVSVAVKISYNQIEPWRYDPPEIGTRSMVKPNDRLVRVSSTPRSAYTFRLSTW